MIMIIDYNGHIFKVINGEYKYNGLTIISINGMKPPIFFNKYRGSKIMMHDMIAIENGKKRRIRIEKIESDTDSLPDSVSKNIKNDPEIENKFDFEIDNDFNVKHNEMLSYNPADAKDNNSTHYSEDKIISFTDWKEYCEYRRDTHQMASKLYQKKNRYFVIPSILLASISGTLSFFATSDTVNESDGQKINLVVGTLAGLSGLIQSFSAAFKFSAKSEAHQIAMESFDILLNKIRFKIARGPEGDDKDKDFLKMIETEIIDIKHRCKFLVPDVIEKNYIDRNYRFIRNKEIFSLKKAYIENKSRELQDKLNKIDISTFEKTLEKNFDAV